MAGLSPRLGRRRLVAAASALALVGSILAVAPGTVLAAAPVISGGLIPPGPISLDDTILGGSGAWTGLSGTVSFTAANGGDFANGTIIVTPPAGFELGAGGAIASSTDCVGATAGAPSVVSGTIRIGVTGTNAAACTVSLSGVTARPTNTVPSSGSMTATFGVALGSVGSLTSVAGAPTRLDFTTQPPANTTVGTTFGVAVRVSDQFGNLVSGASDTIHLTKSTGPGTFGCTGGTTVATSSGTASFTGCSFDAAGTYTLLAAGLTYGTVGSASSVVTTPSGSNKLVFTGQPGSASAPGGLLSTQPVVQLQTIGGTLITGDNTTLVTLSIKPGTGTPGAVLTCSGGNPLSVTGGIAQFSGCRINLAGSGYQLQATAGFLPGSPTPDTSLPFNVGGGAADHLVFLQWPASTTASALSPAPIVQVVDAGGFAVAALYQVTLTLVPVNGFGSLFCTNNPDFTGASTGRITFVGCTVNSPGTYFLTATAPGLLGAAASPQFTVGTGSTQLVFTTQPLGATLGAAVPVGSPGVAWNIQPVVAVRTLGGATITGDFTTLITLSIVPGTPTSGGPGTLTCTSGTTVQVSAGVASFNGCSINTSGTNYQIRATATSSATIPSGSRVDSLAFSIGGTGNLLRFTQYPLSTTALSAGVAWPSTSQPIVAVTDLAGNVLTSVSGITVQLAIKAGTGTSGAILTCSNLYNQATVTNGYATFSGCKIDRSGTGYQLVATATTTLGQASVTSLAFNIGATALTTITLTTYPSVVTWGDPFTLTVQFSVPGAHTFTVQRLAAAETTWQVIPSASSTYTTDSTGRAVFQYTPRFNGQYKIVFAGDATASAATSNTTTVNVRNLVLLRPSWTGTKTVAVNFTETYSATVRPVPSGGLPGGVASVSFEFWKLSGSTWMKAKAVTVGLNSSGVGTLKYTWNSAGQWYIRARTLPNTYNFWATSVLQRINVQ